MASVVSPRQISFMPLHCNAVLLGIQEMFILCDVAESEASRL